MKSIKNIITIAALFTAFMAVYSCQKIDHPELGDYPKDTNPPGGPLKFYAAMDETNVDSIRANYGTNNNASIDDGGISGQAAQFDGTQNGFINYPSANDFASSSDFTISFWMNITLAQKDHEHAVGIMSLANTLNVTNGPNGFWGNFTIFADHENSLSDSMPLKITFFKSDSTTSFDATSKRWPGIYDGQWHHIAFTFASATAQYNSYLDGQLFETLTIPKVKFAFASQLIVGGFQEAAGIVSSYTDNTWMAGFPGMIDNVRLYGVTLSATEVQDIYDSKD